MDIPYKSGNERRQKSYLPKVMLGKIAAKIRQMEAQHASPSRIEVSNMLHEAISVQQEYYKGVAISLQYLPVTKRFSQEVKHPFEAYVSLFCKSQFYQIESHHLNVLVFVLGLQKELVQVTISIKDDKDNLIYPNRRILKGHDANFALLVPAWSIFICWKSGNNRYWIHLMRTSIWGRDHNKKACQRGEGLRGKLEICLMEQVDRWILDVLKILREVLK
ncbi:MAG: hypothetical protein EZS28_024701 [Streblomastix strix]|uniref:Uncharacterized protein n=1 Tax=Streblomastix strix TaxID=222440 RepID=A0A5J4VB65_9EUKA|nr:MAG: hypothetical protein EZS28_024701 [Streblomastix strix]